MSNSFPHTIISLIDDEVKTIDHIKKKRKSVGAGPSNVITIVDSDESDDDVVKVSATSQSLFLDSPRNSSELDDDEIEVLDAATVNEPVVELFDSNNINSSVTSTSAKYSNRTSTSSRSGRSRKNKHSRLLPKRQNGEEEVQTVGQSNVMRLPHNRQNCVENKFVEDVLYKMKLSTQIAKKDVREGKLCNHKFCDLCYCFVCDSLASQCKMWNDLGDNGEKNHCLASDKGSHEYYWKKLREEHKSGKEKVDKCVSPSNISAVDFSELLTNAWTSIQEEIVATSSPLLSRTSLEGYGFLRGPYAPDDTIAVNDTTLTKCRKCKWFTKFNHNNFNKYKTETVHHKQKSTKVKRILELNEIGDKDWCHKCGRISDTRDFGKAQSTEYIPTRGDLFLGKQTIKFRILAHDPRQIPPFQNNWKQFENKTPEWTYDPKEAEYDMFRQRIGKFPTIQVILDSIPILEEKKIPKTGMVSILKSSINETEYRTTVSATETEAILLRHHNDKVLLEELAKFPCIGEKNDVQKCFKNEPLRGTIKASWNKIRQEGIFTISLYLRSTALINEGGAYRKSRGQFSNILGAWFGIFPFKLSELTNGIPAKEITSVQRQELLKMKTDRFPDILTASETISLSTTSDKEKKAVKKYNEEARKIWKGHTYEPSSGSYNAGGICNTDTSFVGILKYYFSQQLMEDAHDTLKKYLSPSILNLSFGGRSELGIVSSHREMRGVSSILGHTEQRTTNIRTYLRNDDHGLITSNLCNHVNSVKNRISTISGLMQHLENLGHKSTEQNCGMNVDLLDFQREAVGFALERELAPFGLQSFLWTKLPTKLKIIGFKSKFTSVYYSPILNIFRTSKPRRVRGGIIAQEMGLGKTVISLAIVLLHPAPLEPCSGIVVKEWETCNSSREWICTSKLEKDPDDASKSRRSIFSRGTLVVCNVSLVGQWIDEAKSKLQDPGLVYSYHGSNRVRDASILAKSSIVVTTYATLCSDTFYHSNKAGGDYCAPCEKIRWWRIICDESHCFRDPSTQKFKALIQISSENRWCVTGTPINTSTKDIKGQIDFIGLEYTNEMFSMMIKRTSVSKNPVINSNYIFLMRNIMIRHSMKQKYKESQRKLMSLPSKVEKDIYISFTKDENKVYEELEKNCSSFYQKFKQTNPGQVSRNYLKLLSCLTPLRIACSGGEIPEEKTKDSEKKNQYSHVYQLKTKDFIECSICMEKIQNPGTIQCKPEPQCIEVHLKINGDSFGLCPVCRAEIITRNDPVYNIPKKNLGIMFKSKFSKLIEELQLIKENEPDAKSLVFSQFTSTLQWMQQELPKHGFKFRTLTGDMSMSKRTQALRDFKKDLPTTIFLLSLRAGAVGINLTQANRVFIMEPAMNPALEAQAIGRVHRLGQQNKVEVIKMYMKNSVETRLKKMLETKYGNSEKGESENDLPNINTSTIVNRDSLNIDEGTLVNHEGEFDLLFGIKNEICANS